MENRSLFARHDEAAVVPVGVVPETGPPVVARGVQDPQPAELPFLPDLHLDHRIESEPFHETAAPPRHDDSVPRVDPLERFLVQVVKVGVRHQHEVDLGHVIQQDTRMLHPFHDPHPLGPVRVEEHRVVLELHEKGGVPDPRHAGLALRRGRQMGVLRIPHQPAENLGNQPVADEAVVAPPPTPCGFDARVIFRHAPPTILSHPSAAYRIAPAPQSRNQSRAAAISAA